MISSTLLNMLPTFNSSSFLWILILLCFIFFAIYMVALVKKESRARAKAEREMNFGQTDDEVEGFKIRKDITRKHSIPMAWLITFLIAVLVIIGVIAVGYYYLSPADAKGNNQVLEPVGENNANVNYTQEDIHTNTAFLKSFYDKYVFVGTNNTDSVKYLCTPQFLKTLKENYQYDCESGDCYALEMFRTGYQDGPSDDSSVKQIQEIKDGWYQVQYHDMGIKGVTNIKLVNQQGRILIDRVKRIIPQVR